MSRRRRPETIAAAAACLRAGGLVAMPTETVYGLAADATSDAAVAGIYAAKGRPTFNPLIAHVLDVAAARREGAFSPGRRTAGGGLLAGPADAGRACRLELSRQSARARGPRHAGDPRSRAPTARALIEAAGVRSSPPRPTARAASVRRPPRMFWPISTAGSTGSSTTGLRATGSNRRSSRA